MVGVWDGDEENAEKENFLLNQTLNIITGEQASLSSVNDQFPVSAAYGSQHNGLNDGDDSSSSEDDETLLNSVYVNKHGDDRHIMLAENLQSYGGTTGLVQTGVVGPPSLMGLINNTATQQSFRQGKVELLITSPFDPNDPYAGPSYLRVDMNTSSGVLTPDLDTSAPISPGIWTPPLSVSTPDSASPKSSLSSVLGNTTMLGIGTGYTPDKSSVSEQNVTEGNKSLTVEDLKAVSEALERISMRNSGEDDNCVGLSDGDEEEK